jgi:hypothetical protein
MSQYKHKISKSRFVSGIQCEKKLYFDLFRSDLKPTVLESQQILFEKGNEVGLLAQNVFPNGVDASPESYYDFSESIAHTKQWINDGIQTIYEASFYYDETLAALDILHHENQERWAIEVKSSTSVKDYHITDASLQYWVMCKSGFKPNKFFLMHIDNSYIRNGEIEPQKLFKMIDITDQVKSNFDWVGDNLVSLKKIKEAMEPKIEIGKHCSIPFECDYIQHCWKHIPEQNSVFHLTNARGKSWNLYHDNILHLADIPDDFTLTTKQKMQVNGVKFNQSNIEIQAIQEFLNDWTYPLYFFDFETIFPAIPILNETSPFQQIPFQYSLHILNKPKGKLIHRDFLANPKDFQSTNGMDPRLLMIHQMVKDLGSTGSIVAYNASFEKNVMKSLAIVFPEYTIKINSLIERFVDLYVVFRNGWYYSPSMGNSASIKSVLPAIAPEFSYKDLEISNGGDASSTFQSMIDGSFVGEPEEVRNQLLKYCERDTLGMVVIWRELISQIGC